ncbi:MAG: hypothetical protein ACRD4Y_02245 [Candidatus Acidiferrales bacterium]
MGQLAALYERTHDAMVAFELAQVHEKAGASAEAIRWYTSAAERFRRAQWKQKAEEALARLGAPVSAASAPAAITESETTAEPATHTEPIIAEMSGEQVTEEGEEMDGGQQESVFEQPRAEAAASPQASENGPGRRRKRRGRRGGRGRNKGARAGAAPGSAPATAPIPLPVPPSIFDRAAEHRAYPEARHPVSEEISQPRAHHAEHVRSDETSIPGSVFQVRTRSGDPALSSRMVKLESQLRRMLACSAHSVDQPEEAPAGPGVFLITDSDQITYYYVEACQTLRVGIGNLLRSGRSSRESGDLKGKLADHLGINEARVGKYLKDHCVVRWLQLDEGAPLLAHFSVAVLRPIANE